MSSITEHASTHGPVAEEPVSRLRRNVAAATVLVCLPYLTLKVFWILGWSVGSDDPDFVDTSRVANVLTAGLELAAIAIAVLFIHPRGRRVPPFLLAGPAWVATGLLAPLTIGIVLGAPLQVLTGGGNPFHGEGGMAGWVFTVVYGGFIAEAVLLLTGFVLYARQRWSLATSGGRPGDGAGATKPLQDLLGIFFVLGATGYAAQQLVYAVVGGGLFDDPSTTQRTFLVVAGLLAAGGAVAFFLLRRGARLRVPVLVLAWAGNAVVFTGTLRDTLSALAIGPGEWGSAGTGAGESVMTLFILLCALGGAAGGALRLVEEQRTA